MPDPFEVVRSVVSRHQETHPIAHVIRAWFWIAMVPVAIYFGWHTSVFLVFLYSTYANFASDLGVYKASQAKRAQEQG